MNKLKMIIICVFQWLKCYRLGERIKLQFKTKKIVAILALCVSFSTNV